MEGIISGIIEKLKIVNHFQALFYTSAIFLFASLFYGETFAFSNEQIAKFSGLWLAISLVAFFLNTMVSLFHKDSAIAVREGRKIFLDKIWWTIFVILLHATIVGIGIFFSFRIF